MNPVTTPSPPQNTPHSDSGFTLIELLVALALLALLAAMMTGSLQFGSRVWERGIAHNEGSDNFRTAQALIQRQLVRSVSSRRSQARDTAFDLFRGRPGMVEFVAPFPAQSGPGGLYRQRLLLDADQLILAWQPAQHNAPGAPRFNMPGSKSIVLLAGVADFEVTYLGSDLKGGTPEWRDEWSEQRLPRLVRIRLASKDVTGHAWPDITVRPRLSVTQAANGKPRS